MSLPQLHDGLAERLRDCGRPIVVTGASGWLGGAALKLLQRALGPAAFSARVRAYAGRPRAGLRPLADLPRDGAGGALLLHFAFRTRGMEEPDFVSDNDAIRATVLNAIEADPPAGVLLPSSGAAYRDADPYGALKRADEAAFTEACRAAGSRLVVARVFNVSGEGMTRPDAYALGSLVTNALNGEPLEVRARQRVRRSFVAAADLLSVALFALVDAALPSPVVFDAVGDEVVEIGDLADRVRRALGRSDLDVRREFDAGLPADDYVGGPDTWRELTARYGIDPIGLDDQIRQTAAALRAG